ncbi:hypothetical protein [Rhizobium sp. BK538]|uniref:hypothetical protein n=1 Tax=Rhizobium sp. BK538 TaxID=2586984 RepID=UPI0016170433|nr:hypothetical protein [Rhizobium sp. BK538]MBB4167659.1 hypothetical protein [Rhizobium sp. BK538]
MAQECVDAGGANGLGIEDGDHVDVRKRPVFKQPDQSARTDVFKEAPFRMFDDAKSFYRHDRTTSPSLPMNIVHF